jgi:hypothetical protein
MRRRIGIVGAGIAGLHLALYLQKHGVDATLITDRAPDEYRGIRLLNTVAHHHVTIAREDYLGVNHWNDPKHHYYYHDHFFNFPQPVSFRGYFSRPSRAVDYRIYLPVLMKDFADRGGRIEYRRIEEGDIAPLVSRFDLLVVSSGKGPLGQLFAYRPEHSPYSQPQRRLCVGLYTGVREPDPMNVTLSVSPGHGEMIVIPTITFGGIASALLMENVPGGDMEELATLSYEATPSTSCASCWKNSKNIIRPPMTASTPRASISRSRLICCREGWCRRFATRWWNSTAANAPSHSATSIRSSIR